jgi:hypothetical protein
MANFSGVIGTKEGSSRTSWVPVVWEEVAALLGGARKPTRPGELGDGTEAVRGGCWDSNVETEATKGGGDWVSTRRGCWAGGGANSGESGLRGFGGETTGAFVVSLESSDNIMSLPRPSNIPGINKPEILRP